MLEFVINTLYNYPVKLSKWENQ